MIRKLYGLTQDLIQQTSDSVICWDLVLLVSTECKGRLGQKPYDKKTVRHTFDPGNLVLTLVQGPCFLLGPGLAGSGNSSLQTRVC